MPGVYQAMEKHGATPDWIVGTSIGATNKVAAMPCGRSRRTESSCRMRRPY